jgi:hypothetical protein
MLFKIVETADAILVTREQDEQANSEAAQAEWDRKPGTDGVYYIRKMEDVADLPPAVALAAYNKCYNTDITKFRDKKIRIQRVWDALNLLSVPTNKPSENGEPGNMATKTKVKAQGKGSKTAKGKTKNGATKGEREPRSFKDIEPIKNKDKVKATRAGSKVSILIDLLSRDTGTTAEEIEKTLSKIGRPSKARSWLAFNLRTQLGYGVKAKKVNGEERLFLDFPEGMRKPLPHKSKGEAAAEK